MTAFDLSSLTIKRVASVSTMFNPCGASNKRYDRPRWSIMLKYEGETVYHCNGKSYLSNIDHVILLPRGCSYEWECTREGRFSFVEFECDESYPEPIVFATRYGDKLLKILKSMESRRNLNRPTEALECKRDTYSMLLLLSESGAEQYTPETKKQKLQPAIEHISQNYTAALTNDALAGLCGMSTVYFRKLFTTIMGVSPIAYARSLRINKAKEMLRGDWGALSDIALSLGYPNLYDFSRDFKKHTGKAPSKWQ